MALGRLPQSCVAGRLFTGSLTPSEIYIHSRWQEFSTSSYRSEERLIMAGASGSPGSPGCCISSSPSSAASRSCKLDPPSNVPIDPGARVENVVASLDLFRLQFSWQPGCRPRPSSSWVRCSTCCSSTSPWCGDGRVRRGRDRHHLPQRRPSNSPLFTSPPRSTHCAREPVLG